MIFFLIGILLLTITALSLFVSPIILAKRKNKDRWASAFYTLFVLFLFVGAVPLLYAHYGKPLMQDYPMQTRQELEKENAPKTVANLKLLERYLKEHPQDGLVWIRLGHLYRSTHNYQRAVRAYRNALEWGQIEDISIWHALAETLIQANDGKIIGEAQKALENVLRYRPDDAKAIYFLGLARLQNKEPQKAIALWRYLEEILLSEDPWLSVIQERISKTQEMLKLNAEKIPAQAPNPLNV